MTIRTALITGAAQGIGEAIARALHQDGVRVAVTDIDDTKAQRVAAALDPTGQTALAMKLDVRQKQDFAAALDTLIETWGHVDILVNNAALTKTTPAMDVSGDEFDEVIAVNLRGALFGCQVLGAHMKARGQGRIINLSSLAGQNGGTVTGVHYAASKAGIVALTKVFARELAKSGVAVNAVAPGPIDVPAAVAALPEAVRAALPNMIPVGRLGQPAEVAAIVTFLASPQAAFVTGATWDVNGGVYMR